MIPNTKIYTKGDLRTHVKMSDEAFEKLEIYHAMLKKWNKAINLVGPKTIEQAWHRHFLDSAQLSRYIPKHAKTIVDMGSGAGFPGLVLAIMHPKLNIHLVESDDRKGQFIRAVSRETNTPVTVHIKRIEESVDAVSPDFITARALASLDQLLQYCYPWAVENPALEMCFLKGIRAEEEVAESQKNFSFVIEASPSTTDVTAQILSITALTDRSSVGLQGA